MRSDFSLNNNDDIFLFTQAPILVWLDGTIIDIISTILVSMYYTVGMLGYDWWLCIVINISVQRWASPRHYAVDPRLLPLGNPFKYHVVALDL